ncbi:(Fe-S)-binding protein [Mycobacterium sp. TNTM28]|uniref:(Fe-S)-binding protein n=1 Tax=[Mycobacterium] fortunisiensis TaxID=2600579 RepID=A0ABS6KHV2_9MYCO|nr:(Fe-S)-binding protein [[Mycobacterium] fortunisiensis]
MVATVRVGLMIPCYVDMFFPQVGKSTLGLLERFGIDVEYPFDQTCCGQPMANSGAYLQARATEELFIRNFAEYDHIVAPSGSCVHHIRNKFTASDDTPARRHVSSHVWDLPEFLCDVLDVKELPWARFPHEVALHVSCSAIRGLSQQTMSERPNDPWQSKPRSLLEKVDGITLTDFDRPDECCGFGGTFAVTDEAVSAAMGSDKMGRIGAAGTRHVVSGDMSCLMHMQGCASRNQETFQFLHLAEVLNGDAR